MYHGVGPKKVTLKRNVAGPGEIINEMIRERITASS
jgi:hypothetical protein